MGRLPLSQWADENFYLSEESSGTEGHWVTRPNQRAIMDCISLDDIEVISWQKCARIGYTKIIVAAMGYFAQHLKRNQVIWQPTDGDAHDFVMDEIDPMLRDVPAVGRILKTAPEKKSKHNTTSKKSFIGSVLDIKGGKSSKNYRRMTKDVGYYDELDGFDPDIDNQGDGPSLGDKRLTQSPFPKSIRGSTPTTKELSQIEQSISQADMRFHRYVPCPACGELQPLLWSQMKFDDSDPSTIRHECPACGYGAVYGDYEDMDALGVWRSVEYDKDGKVWDYTGFWMDESGDELVLRDTAGKLVAWPAHIGFWIWGAYSYDLSWARMADEFLKANQAKKAGKIEELKTFINTRLGETWEEKGESVDERMLYRRREHYGCQVPAGVQFITAWADLQADRIECEVCGWGWGEESWSIDYIRLYGDPAKAQLWEAFAERLRQSYLTADNAKVDIRLVGVDSGYLPDEVYKFCLSQGVKWVIPTKGHSVGGKPIIDFPRKPNKKHVYLTMLGTDTAKELIYNRYEVQKPGPGYCHYPVRDEYDETYFEQATAEKKIKHYSRGVPYYVWDAGKRRNEALDCRVGNLAMIRIAQQHGGFRFVDNAEPLTEKTNPTPRAAKTTPPAARQVKRRRVISKGINR